MTYDLVIIGGGIYGAALALEASHRNLRAVLLEKEDFGGATSWNSLRIVHGGLRYLQNLDLTRFRESVRERSWFLRTFPEHVQPLACMMPLYGKGLRRRSVLQIALGMNDWLSRHRNRDLSADRWIPRSRLLSAEETIAAFPAVERQGLQGAALWFDGVMPNSQRLLIEMLRWACGQGARALNYTRAVELLQDTEGVEGVRAIDTETGSSHIFRAPHVVNAAGPWCREIARDFDRDQPDLFRPSVGLNVLLNRPPLAKNGIAVSPPPPATGTYFLYSWEGFLLAGSFHAPWHGSVDQARPIADMILPFLARLNEALPSLDVNETDVLRVHWGLLPTKRAGSDKPTTRDVFVNHENHGGPKGLFSISGVKFTTARAVAERTLVAMGLTDGRTVAEMHPPRPREVSDRGELLARLQRDPEGVGREIDKLISEESVVRFEDLMLRRTNWGVIPSAELEQNLRSLLARSSSRLD